MHLPAQLLTVSMLTASVSASASFEPHPPCHPPGTLTNKETGTSTTVIDSLDGHNQMRNCITTNDQSQTVELSIEFTQQLIDQLPAQIRERTCECETWTMPLAVDNRAFSDDAVCSFKADMECAKGYRAFGDFPAQFDSPIDMTMVLWRPLGLFNWSRVHSKPQIGFYFYFNVNYYDIEALSPGWSDDFVHVVEDLNQIVQIPIPPTTIPINYVQLGFLGARAGTGGFMMKFKDYDHQSDLLWGYYGGKQAFINPTYLKSAFDEISTECTLNGIKPDGETAGSGYTPSALMPCTEGLWCDEIPWPREFSTGGTYPSEYCIKYQQTEKYQYAVSVRNFRTGTQVPEPDPEPETLPANSATSIYQTIHYLALLPLALALWQAAL